MADLENYKDKKQTAKVDAETARLEVKRFLDLKRVDDTRREGQFSSSIEALEALMCAGRLSFDFDESKRATYKFLVPLIQADGSKLTEIKLRFFLGVQESLNALKNIDVGDTLARSLVVAATLSGNPPAIFRSNKNEVGENGLDVSDNNSLVNYTSFFLA